MLVQQEMPLRPTENEQLRAEIVSLRERLAEQLRIASSQSERVIPLEWYTPVILVGLRLQL